MAQGKIQFQVGFNVDQSGLNTLKASLQNLQNLTVKDIVSSTSVQDANKKLEQVKQAASTVEKALQQSFNPTLNSYNIDKFKQSLLSSNSSIAQIKNGFSQAGAAGKQAFSGVVGALTKVQLPLKESYNLLTQMGTTLANTARWMVASSALQSITSSIQKAWSFTTQLDESLNNIMIVTGKTSDEMERFAKYANNASKALGATTKDYTNAALIYYQQGLNQKDVLARSDVTVKAANVTGQSTQQVSEQLTAIWNGYKVSAEEAELYIDKVSKVAATTAADLQELSEGMQKVASGAATMGVDIDQLNAQLATIISVTRQDASVVGTALKTVFARLGDLAVEGTDEFGTTLGEVSSKLKVMGIDILDSKGDMREMGDVIEEVAAKWGTWTSAQQQAAAVAMAGKRQYNNLIALFENWDMYESAKATSQGGAGELEKQNQIYLESFEAKTKQVQASTEKLYMTLLNPEGFKSLIDVFSSFIDGIAVVVSGMGGGFSVLMSLLPLLIKSLAPALSKGLVSFISNVNLAQEKTILLKNNLQTLNELKTQGLDNYDKKIVLLKENLTKLAHQGVITNGQFTELNEQIDEMSETYRSAATGKEYAKNTAKNINKNVKKTFLGKEAGKEVDAQVEALAEAGEKAANAGLSEIEAGQRLTSNNSSDLLGRYNLENVNAQNALKSFNTSAKRLARGGLKVDNNKNFNDDFINNSYEQLKQVDNSYKSVLTRQKNNYEEAKKQYNDLLETGNASTEKIQESFNKVNEAAKKYGATAAKAGEQVKSSFENSSKELNKLGVGAFDKVENKAKALGATLQKTFKNLNLQSATENMINFASNIGFAASAVSNLKNLFQSLGDESVPLGEKITQALSTIGISLLMLKPTILGLINFGTEGINLIKLKQINTSNLMKTESMRLGIQTAQIGAEETELLNSPLKIKANILEAKTIDELSDEQAEELAMRIANIATYNPQLAMQLLAMISHSKEAANIAIKTVATEEDTKATIANTIAKYASNLILLAIIAAVALLSVGIYAIVKAYNAEADAMKAANERAKELHSALDEAKSSYDELKSSIENYAKAKDSIKDLKQGTLEWKEAIADANAEVKSLIKTYPELAKYLEKDNETGLLSIDEEGLEKLQEEEFKKVQVAEKAAVIGDQVARRQTLDYQYLNTARKVDVWNATQLDADKVRQIAELSFDTIANDTKFEEALTELNVTNQDMIDSLIKNKDAIYEVQEQIEENNKLLAIENAQLYQDQLTVQGYSIEEASVLGGMIAADNVMTAETQKQIDARAEMLSKHQGDATYRENLIKQWASAMGIDIDAGSIYGTMNGNFQYRVDGEEKTVSWDTLGQELAQWEYQTGQTAWNNVLKQQGILNDLLKGSNNEAQSAIKKVLASNNAISRSSLEDYNQETLDQIEALFNGTNKGFEELTDEQKKLLIETHGNLKKYYSLEGMSEELGWYSTDSNSVQSVLESVGVEDWGVVARETVGNALNAIALNSGQIGLSAVSDYLATSGLSNDTIKQFFEKTDWASENIYESALSSLDELGVELDFDSKSFSNFAYYLGQLNTEAGYSSKTFKEISDITKDLSEFGKTIEEEDYKKLLTTYGSDIANYFTIMADGTYALTTSALQFQKALDEKHLNKIKDNIDKIFEGFENRDKVSSALSDLLNDRQIDKNVAGNSEAEKSWKAWSGTGSATNATDFVGTKSGQTYTYDEIVNNGKYVNGGQAQVQKILTGYLLGDFYDTKDNKKRTDELREHAKAAGLIDDEGNIDYSKFDSYIQDAYLNGDENIKLDNKVGFWETLFADGVEFGTTSFKYADLTGGILSTIQKSNFTDAGIVAQQYTKSWANSVVVQLKELGAITEEEFNDVLKDIEKNENNYLNAESEFGFNKFINEKTKNTTLTDEQKQEYRDQIESELNSATSVEQYDTLIKHVEKNPIFKQVFSDSEWEALKKSTADLRSYLKYTNDIEVFNSKLEIQKTIYEGISNELSKLQAVQDTLYGQDKIDNLNAQNDLIKEQIANLERQKIIEENIAKTELAFRKDTDTDVEGAFKTYLGISENTDITLEEALSSFGLNSLTTADDYNKLISTMYANAGEDQYKLNAIKLIQQKLEPYFLGQTEESIKEAWRTIQENNLAEFEVTLDSKLEITDAQAAYAEFIRNLTDEDDYAKIADTYVMDLGNAVQAWGDITESIREFQALNVNDADYQTKLAELREKWAENALAFNEAYKSIIEQQVNAFEDLNSEYEKYIGYMETIVSLLDKQQTLNAMIYGDEAYDQLATYYQEAAKYTEAAANGALAQYEANRAEFERIKDDPTVDEEYREAVTSAYVESGEAALEALNQKAEILQKQYLNSIELEIKNFENNVLGDAMNEMQAEWDWVKKNQELYMDDINAQYGLGSLRNKFSAASRSTSDINIQRRINALMEEELSILESRDKLSEYDLERAEKRLNILQAENDLENSRNQKTTMRLMRGIDGGYSYQYVADQNAVEEAQQKLLDAQNELYNFDKNRFDEMTEEYISAYNEFIDKLREYSADGVISAFEQEDLDNYKKYLEDVADVTIDVRDNLATSAKDMVTTFGSEWASQNIDELIGTTNTKVAEAIEKFDVAKLEGLQTSVKNMGDEFSKALKSISNEMDVLLNGSKGENGSRSGGLIDALKQLGDKTIKIIVEDTQPALDKINGIVTEVGKVKTEWDNAKDAMSDYFALLAGIDVATLENLSGIEISEALNNIFKGIGNNITAKQNYDNAEEYIRQNWVDSFGKGTASVSDWEKEEEFVSNYWNKLSDDQKDSLEEIYAKQPEASVGTVTAPSFTDNKPVDTEATSPEEPEEKYFNANLVNLRGTGISFGYDPYTANGNSVAWLNYGGNKQYRFKYPSSSTQAEEEQAKQLESFYEAQENKSALVFDKFTDSIFVRLNKIWYKIADYPDEIKSFIPFDTGGYTGSWGSEGRLAMLHEKELVLNKFDTANILAAVDLISRLDNSMLETISHLSSGTSFAEAMWDTAKEMIIEQNVRIDANFPAVNSKAEIEEAFFDLVNLASQHAFKNDRAL